MYSRKRNEKLAFREWDYLFILALRNGFYNVEDRLWFGLQGKFSLDKMCRVIANVFPGIAIGIGLYDFHQHFGYYTVHPVVGILSFAADFVSWLCWVAFFALIFYNFGRMEYNLNYTKTAWWNNTGVLPSSIVKNSDKGLYGEYIATMAMERSMLCSTSPGMIFNNVILPNRNGDYTEIDIIAVNRSGVFVMEAKGYSGLVSGDYSGNMWIQRHTRRRGRHKEEIREHENPIIQNLHHCNFLSEFIYSRLPEGSLKDRWSLGILVNMVIFSAIDIRLNLTGNLSGFNYYITYAEKGRYALKDFEPDTWRNTLSDEDIAIISDIIDSLPRYTAEERKLLQGDRQAAYERGKFLSKYTYFLASYVDQGTGGEGKAVCRDDGYYTMYLLESGFFVCEPAHKITFRGKEYRRLESIPKEEYVDFFGSGTKDYSVANEGVRNYCRRQRQ